MTKDLEPRNILLDRYNANKFCQYQVVHETKPSLDGCLCQTGLMMDEDKLKSRF